MNILDCSEVCDHGEGTKAVNGYKVSTFSVIHLQLVAEDGGAHVVDSTRLRKTDLDDVR